jgi:glycosyltransferase involved in cell wall biosynthesis
VGRLAEEQKRISEVARAFCRVTQQLEGVEAIIYGDGPDRQNVVDILENEGASAKVTLAGSIPSDQIQQRLIEQCDTVVLLSDYEGLPISLLEAMTCGLVPVCLKIRSGIPELIDHGVTGMLVDDREQSFTAAIQRLRDDDALWHRQSEAARERVIDANSLDATASLWVELFNCLQKEAEPRKRVAIPNTLDLPPVNPGFMYEDVRRPSPDTGRRYQKLWKSLRRFVGNS